MRNLRQYFAVLVGLAFCHFSLAGTISSFSPTFGQPGTVITVNGSGFSNATNLVFNPTAPVLGDFTILSDSQLIGVVPIGATTGTLSVAISNSTPATSSSTFTVAPQVTSLSPAVGMPGTILYIGGVNFVLNGTTVTFNGMTNPIAGTVESSTEVAATVPTGANTGPVTVTTSAGSTVSTNIFTTGNLPTISSFSPAAGSPGSTVVINGGNFVGTPTVYIGGVKASATVTSTSQISATVPTGATNGPIEVVTSYGSVTSSTTFATGAGAIVTGFSPTIGTKGTVVTISGAGLATTNVNFNGHPGSVTSYSANSIQVTVPNASGTGPIEVFTPQGNFITSTNFTNTTGPVINSFSPVLGPAGSTVVIGGFNFTGATGVSFTNVSAKYTVTAGTQISATVPSGFSYGTITVSSNSSSSTTTSNFSVSTAAPYITGFSPPNGVRGTVVTVNGGNFENLSSVQFNGVSTTYTPLTSTTVLYATVPGGAATGAISVRSSTGTGGSPTSFYLQPWITNATAGGFVNSAVVIQGRNLSGATAVQLNGVNCVPFSDSANQITTTVPANATTGPFTVTTQGGTFINTNSFVVEPDVYSFTPTLGPAGTVVTVNGTSFTGVTNVQFHGKSAPPSNVTSNQLQVAVPAGATSGPLTLFVPGGSGVSSNSFTVTSNSAVNLTKTGSPTILGPGTNVTYTLFVSNAGPSIVTYLSVTDDLPSGFTLGSYSTSVGTATVTNNVIVANLGTLSTNATATITVQGTSATPGTLTNAAYLGFAEGETIYGTNYGFALTYFINAGEKTLAARRAGPNEVLVTWPASGVNFNLQASTNLGATNNRWQNVTGIIVVSGTNEYSNSIPTNGWEFFRLEAPQ